MTERPTLDPGITMPYLNASGLPPDVYDALVHAANAVGRHMKGAAPMTDTDLREQVARALMIEEHRVLSPGWNPPSWEKWAEHLKSRHILSADAALAVAEPAIRKRVIEELAQKAGDTETSWSRDGGQTQVSVADWLRSQQEGSE